MSSYEENDLIAKELLKKLRHIVSPADFIDVSAYRCIPSENEIQHIRNVYGNGLQNFWEVSLNDLRQAVEDIILNEENEMSDMTHPLVITEFNYGACGELAYRIIYELLKLGRKDAMIMVLIDGDEPINNHAVVVLGLCADECTNTDLNQLPDHCIIIDPLLHHVGHANTYRQDFKKFIKKNNFTITEITEIDIDENNIEEYLKQVAFEINLCTDLLKNKGFSPDVSRVSHCPRLSVFAEVSLLNCLPEEKMKTIPGMLN